MKKIIYLLPLIFFGLVGCNNRGGESKPTPTPTPTPEVKTVWNDTEVNLMKEHLNGLIIPNFDSKEADWYYDTQYDCLSIEFSGSNDDVDSIATEIAKTDGFTLGDGFNADDLYVRPLQYLFIEDTITGYASLDVYSDGTNLEVDAYTIDVYTTWDKAVINEHLGLVGVSNVEIPSPEFKYSYFEFYTGDVEYGMVSIIMTVDKDYSSNYIETLLANDYQKIVDNSTGVDMTFYSDPAGTVLLDVYYDADFNQVLIDIYTVE